MDKTPRTGGLFHLIALTVIAGLLIRGLAAGNPNVERLDSREWQHAVENDRQGDKKDRRRVL